jgi:hypothetical protein
MNFFAIGDGVDGHNIVLHCFITQTHNKIEDPGK